MPPKTIVFSEKAAVKSLSHGREVSLSHTRLLRTSLCLEESRAYWKNYRVDTFKENTLEENTFKENTLKENTPKEKLAVVAFEERWFGSKSMARVRSLLVEFHHRFEAYPIALTLLRLWCPSDLTTRQNICHWHMQLTDPLYRAFTGVFLEQRRQQPNPSIDRDIVARWVTQQFTSEWSSATTLRMATGLIGASAAAGLCTENSGTRLLKFPQVTDEALAYWVYFLRHLSFQGSILDNPYFNSVGLNDTFLEKRLRSLPGITFNRMGELYDFGWHYPDLKTWGIKVLGIEWEDAL
jgi:hypothetical protein